MTAREVATDHNHIHQCLICDEEVSCDNPNDPQDCLFISAICDSCSDGFQELLPGEQEDEFKDWEPTEDQAEEREPTVDYASEMDGRDPGESDDDYFDGGLQGDQEGSEEWLNDEPVVRTEPLVTKPLKKKKSRGKKKTGSGWKKG